MHSIDWSEFLDFLIRLVVATLAGGAMGLERQMQDRWAGLRTHMMVSLGSAVFTITGVLAAESNPADLTRVIQGVATGVGFLGAGTILKLAKKKEIHGLTTAGSIWMSAGVGVAAGMANYALVLAGACISLFVLAVVRHFEHKVLVTNRDAKGGRK
jgi:putative Mg2+ transporter-C (MgtC) family protein